MEFLRVGAAVISPANDEGMTRIERLSTRVVRFTTVGFLSGPLAQFALEHSQRILDDLETRPGDRLAGFYDWEAMTGYASEARVASTSFMSRHRHRYSCAMILTGSTIVSMGVNVANAILGGVLTATTQRSILDDKQSAALALDAEFRAAR